MKKRITILMLLVLVAMNNLVNACNPFTPTITANGPTTFCQGGSVTLDGGVYSMYQWNNGATTETITATTGGVYSLTVTDGSGCTGTNSQTIIVNVNPTPVMYSYYSSTFCDGGFDLLYADQAHTYTAYLWNTMGSDNFLYVYTSGNYFVTVTDSNGCTGTTSQIITVNSNPTPTITPTGNITIAAGDSVVLDAGTFAAYNWITGETTETITVNATGTYVVTVTSNNGCTAQADQSVTVVPCSAYFTIAADTAPHHYLITNLAIGASPIHYDWNWGDSNHDTIPYPTHTYANAGTYDICLTITDAASCTNNYCYNGYQVTRVNNTMVTMTVIHPTVGMNNINDDNAILIYPNPASTTLTLRSQLGFRNEELRITDVLGNKVYSQALTQSPESSIDISKLSNGIYFYELVGQRGKLVVQH